MAEMKNTDERSQAVFDCCECVQIPERLFINTFW